VLTVALLLPYCLVGARSRLPDIDPDPPIPTPIALPPYAARMAEVHRTGSLDACVAPSDPASR
jgi:hypothetical protein